MGPPETAKHHAGLADGNLIDCPMRPLLFRANNGEFGFKP
jgi:hypothetical protein